MHRPDELTVEQKLGRVLCMRATDNPDNYAFTLEMVRRRAVGCVQVPINERSAAVIAELRAEADYPLLIYNDMERGFPPAELPPVSLLALAACTDTDYARAFAAGVAHHARRVGYSGCWGPVLDILFRDAPCTVSRCAGDSPEAVYKVAREINATFAEYGFFGTGKHYPGGQDMPLDTHMVEGVSQADEEFLREVALRPYLSLMQDGLLTGIMTAHTRYPKIDPEHPASLSKKVISLIRDAGYDGLIFTDSLAMMGILQRYGEEGAMALALEAGNDIILPNYRTPMRNVYEMMLSAYRAGKISDARLDEAVRHVMEAEERWAQMSQITAPVPENLSQTLQNVARDAITAVCADGVSPAIDPKQKRLFVVMTEQGYAPDAPNDEIGERAWYSPRRVSEAIRANFEDAEILTLREFPTAQENERVLNAATQYSEVVFITYCNTAPYLGTDGLTRRAESVIHALAMSGKLVALVHFGNPLAISGFDEIPRRLLGYVAPDAQRYALEVLAGRLPAKGRLPISCLFK